METSFDYEKVYCIHALPAFDALSDTTKEVFNAICVEVEDLRQQSSNLLIPLADSVQKKLNKLTTTELAKLSRASYAVGHWRPELLPPLFNNKKGQSWKVTNCCDQVLRQRLTLPPNVEVHKGVFRVTFESRDYWLWEEFALATEENLEEFERLSTYLALYSEDTFHDEVEKLKLQFDDMWVDEGKNELYREFLALKRKKETMTPEKAKN